MFQSEETRRLVEELTARQQSLVTRWKASRFDVAPQHAERLRRVIASAHQLPFYAERHRDVVLPAPRAGEDHLPLLQALPLITKPDAHRIGEEVLTLRRDRMLNYFETSGTTGVPSPTPKSLDEIVVNTVNFGEGWAEVLDPADVALVLINTPQGPAAFQFERVFNYLGIMTFRTWVDTLRNDYGRVLEITRRCRPTVYGGPPSQLINLYEHAHRVGCPPPFDQVLLLGEPAGPALRRRLAQLSGGSVFDASFGSSETGTTAVTWAGRTLRLQTHSFLFELRAGDELVPLAPGASGTGELVVTGLQNLDRPLLRYCTGDLVTVSAQDDGAQFLTPHGRVADQLQVGGARLTQNELENLIWPQGLPGAVFNYLVAYDDDRTDVVVTASACTVADERTVAGELADRLSGHLPGVAVHVVEQLPVVATLGSAMGWKAARTVDLRRASEDQLPPTIAAAVQARREFVQGLRARALATAVER